MFDILFINSIQLSWGFAISPIGTMSLTSVLRSNNYRVGIVDFNLLWEQKRLEKHSRVEDNMEEMCDYILNLHPTIVAFSTMSSSHHVAIALSQRLKEKNSIIKIIFGGPQASLVALPTMEAYPFIDLIAIGEGEGNIVEITDALLNNKSLSNIKGIIYRNQGMLHIKEGKNLIGNLDELPIIDYSSMDLEREKLISLDIGRGCPYQCIYCCTKTFWKQKYRLKSVDRIIQEIEYIMERYKKKSFIFQHDLFTLDKKKVEQFCNTLIERKLSISWACSARVDTLNEKLIQLMHQAGCKKIFLGIETGSARMQKVLKKNLNLSYVWEICKILKAHHIDVDASFLYGLPEETTKDLNDTLTMIIQGVRKGYWFPQLYLCNVESGTELYQMVKERLYLSCPEIYAELCSEEEFDYFKGMIIKSSNIFPHFYDFEAETRQSYLHLSKFIWFISSLMVLGMHATIRLIIHFYHNNITMFYRDFIRLEKTGLFNLCWEDVSFADLHNDNSIRERLCLMEHFVETMDFGILSDLIKEMYQFETSLYHLKHGKNQLKKVEQRYQHDIITVRMKEVTEEILRNHPCRVVLMKENNQIRIQKSSLTPEYDNLKNGEDYGSE